MEKLIIGDLPIGSNTVEQMQKPKKLEFELNGKAVFTAEAVIDHKKMATFRQWQKPGSILPQHMIQKYSHWLRDYGKWAHQVNSKAKPTATVRTGKYGGEGKPFENMAPVPKPKKKVAKKAKKVTKK